MEDKKLVQRVVNGEDDAFKELFFRYYNQLCNFVGEYISSQSVAEDIVQEVFENIWDEREALDPTKNIKTYLYQAVKYRAFDKIKHQQIVKKSHSEIFKNRTRVAFQNDHVGDDENLVELVQDVIEDLPAQTRRIYKLNRKDGLTYKEIARVLDLSPKSIEYHISKALKELRLRLDKNSVYSKLKESSSL